MADAKWRRFQLMHTKNVIQGPEHRTVCMYSTSQNKVLVPYSFHIRRTLTTQSSDNVRAVFKGGRGGAFAPPLVSFSPPLECSTSHDTIELPPGAPPLFCPYPKFAPPSAKFLYTALNVAIISERSERGLSL